MKQQLEEYMLTKPEITAFRELTERELSISELAMALDKSNPLASLVIKSLQRKGFVETSREGTRKVVTLALTSHAQYLADLIENEPYVPWEQILSYSNTKVLLERLLSIKLGKQVSDTTKWRAIRNLAAHGMLATPEQTALNSKLKMFVEAYADYASRMIASRLLPKGAVTIWRKGEKILFKFKNSEKLTSAFHRTAISVFPLHGIKFISDEDYYFYNPEYEDVSLEDIVMHTLLIDPSSPTYISYALLLFVKERKSINQRKLRISAEEYDLLPLIESMIRYLESKGSSGSFPLPKWEEFRQLASLYDVETN